mgnify:CR=1 FL=1
MNKRTANFGHFLVLLYIGGPKDEKLVGGKEPFLCDHRWRRGANSKLTVTWRLR